MGCCRQGGGLIKQCCTSRTSRSVFIPSLRAHLCQQSDVVPFFVLRKDEAAALYLRCAEAWVHADEPGRAADYFGRSAKLVKDSDEEAAAERYIFASKVWCNAVPTRCCGRLPTCFASTYPVVCVGYIIFLIVDDCLCRVSATMRGAARSMAGWMLLSYPLPYVSQVGSTRVAFGRPGEEFTPQLS